MELQNNKVPEGEVDGGGVQLPGFRFHPTDEELLGFYLKRKIEKRAIGIELIKQADIYKYDPWDLQKSGNVGDKEWYFFCKRGRKYKNSIRPNRVTGSGFWKATGIDKPIYASGGEEGDRYCIGLKKSLVYYRGCAGKGSKTDWMMHEFRLPPAGHEKSTKHIIDYSTKSASSQEAEVWTLCRIFKRTVSYRKACLPDWRELSVRRGITVNPISDAGSKTCSMDSSHHHNSCDINFNPGTISSHANQQAFRGQPIGSPELITSQASSSGANSSFTNGDMNELLRQAEYWEDDLRSIVNCAVEGTIMGNPFYL